MKRFWPPAIPTGPLHYNTGNAYYRIDQYGQALRHWEKARRIMGSGPELDHNIEIIKARIGTPFSVVPDPFWVTWWRTLIVPLGPFFYLSAGLILYFVAALLFGMRIWYRRQGAMLRRVRVGSVILSLLLLATALGISRSGSLISQAVVITDSAKLSEELGVEGRIDVPEGVIVSILAHEETHYKVRIPNGLEGFIPARAVGEI